MGLSEIMLAWEDDNSKLPKNILWMSTDQNQEHVTNWNRKFEILSPLFLLILQEMC
jgi:hypothetical protein